MEVAMACWKRKLAEYESQGSTSAKQTKKAGVNLESLDKNGERLQLENLVAKKEKNANIDISPL